MPKSPPEGYHSVTPYLTVGDADAAIAFYAAAFGAEELFRMPMGDRIGHAEIRIGDSRIMLSDEFPEMKALAPATLGGTSGSLMLYVEGVDAAFARAIAAGATEERAVADQFYGDRSGTLLDPFGHRWTLSTQIEELDFAEVKRRLDAL